MKCNTAAKLTLEDIYALEAEHSPLVGSGTSVYLSPFERAGSINSLKRLHKKLEFALDAAQKGRRQHQRANRRAARQ
jgi:hypothetical protein